MIKTRTWIIIIAVLLFGSVALLLLWPAAKAGSRLVQIVQDGNILREIDLEAVPEPYEFTVTAPAGGSNTIRVEPGRICIRQADCPDKSCVRQGWLSEGITPLVCLPHRLMVLLKEGS